MDESAALAAFAPLLKLLKDREDMFFAALRFANKNIESSSNDLNPISIFSKFVAEARESEAGLSKVEAHFLQGLLLGAELDLEGQKISSASK